jgi:hypothetical protein
VEHGFGADETILILSACEGPHNLNDHESTGAQSLLEKMSANMSAPGSNSITYSRGQPLVAFGPEHAATIGGDGVSKEDVKRFLFEHARYPAASLSNGWPPSERRVADSWNDIEVFVAGGAGKHSCWFPTFGMTGTIVKRVEDRAGRPVRTLR